MIQRVILAVGQGQTCNRVWQVIHWIPTIIRLGLPLYFPGFRRYAQLFTGTAGASTPRYPRDAPPLPVALAVRARFVAALGNVHPALASQACRILGHVPGHVAVDLDALRAHPQDLVHPRRVVERAEGFGGGSLWVHGSGWCVDSAGVGACHDRIRDFFAPDDEAAQRVACVRNAARADGAVLVGMHLRRGDYRKWRGGAYCFDDATFGRAMRQMLEALSPRRPRFVLVSNEPVDLRNYAGFDVVTGPGDMVSDLYLLAACDFLLGPPSTFTSWASFYGGVPLRQMENTSAPLRLDEFRVA